MPSRLSKRKKCFPISEIFERVMGGSAWAIVRLNLRLPDWRLGLVQVAFNILREMIFT
jgi:hypothetical protein